MADERLISQSWQGGTPPPMARLGARDWLRVIRRGVPGLLVLAIGVPLLMALRLLERPFTGRRRPVSESIT